MKIIENKQFFMKKVGRLLSSPVFLGTLLCAVLVGSQLFGRNALGYGDNGGFERTLLSNGVFALKGQDYLGSFTPKYGLLQYFNENQPAFFSSQGLFIQCAIWLNKLFYSQSVFDLRFLGFIYYCCYLVALALLLAALTQGKRNWKSYSLAALVVIILSDAANVLNLNSFYPEAVTLITIVAVFASFLWLLRPNLRQRWLVLGYYLLNLALLLTAKEQNIFLLVGVVMMTVAVIGVTVNKKRRLILLLTLTLVVAISGGTFVKNVTQNQNVLKYSAVTKGVFAGHSGRTRSLQHAQISKQYVLMTGEDYYPTEFVSLAPNSRQVKRDFVKRIHYSWIIKHYLIHPGQLHSLLDVAGGNLMQTRVKGVGNYLPGKHQSGTQTRGWAWFSFWFERVYPTKFAFNLMLAVVLVLVYSAGFYNDRKKGSAIGWLKLVLMTGMLLNVLLLPVGVIILQGSMNLAQSLLPAALSLQLVLLLLLSDILNGSLWSSQKDIENEREQ
ncbi:MAG TPA: hypothetical protein H9869_01680 [Candidatus Ligilactobacillus excrementipullorum]|nr:hypothetical protein [Candidatus Ligilactobacillus excrementipullorum]